MKWENCTLNDICDKANGHIQTGPLGQEVLACFFDDFYRINA